MAKAQNFLYPLPEDRLVDRFSRAFASLAQGNSATIWAFPNSCGTAYLKFVLSQSDLLQTLMPHKPSKHQFLILDFNSMPALDTLSFHKHLLHQVSTMIDSTPGKKSTKLNSLQAVTKDHLSTDDAYSIFQHTQALIHELTHSTPLHLTFVIYDYLLDEWEEAWGRNLYKLWSTHRKHPDTRISFLFVTKPYPTPDELTPFLRPLRIAYYESVSHFPLFSQEETIYSLDRLEQLYGIAISPSMKRAIWQEFGGYYACYLPAMKSIERYGDNPRDIAKAWRADETLRYHAKTLHTSLPIKSQQHIEDHVNSDASLNDALVDALGIVTLPKLWHRYVTTSHLTREAIHQDASLPETIKLTEPLTALEHAALAYLSKHPNTLVTKDAIAEAIWGDSEDSYSDWALDKLMSRLRAKVTTTTSLKPILTVRGKGYKYVS